MNTDRVFPIAATVLISLGMLIFFWRRKRPSMYSQDFHPRYAV